MKVVLKKVWFRWKSIDLIFDIITFVIKIQKWGINSIKVAGLQWEESSRVSQEGKAKDTYNIEINNLYYF